MTTSRELPGPPWTILSTLQWTADYFKRHTIESPRTDAEVLLAHSLGCRRLDLYLRYDQPLKADELAAFRGLIKRRVAREPVAYIVGQKEFWSLDFEVGPAVLIPRPETEGLVETALEFLPASGHGADESSLVRNILELGTGSGAIITALAGERPGHTYLATELSSEALMLARRNARRHLPADAIRFVVGRWFDPLASESTPEKMRFDMIVSNPPYIRTDEIDRLAPEIVHYEPRAALDGGADGLRDIIHLLKHAPQYLKSGGMLLMEIGHDQYAAAAEYAQLVGGYDRVEVRQDLAGFDRVVCLRKQ